MIEPKSAAHIAECASEEGGSLILLLKALATRFVISKRSNCLSAIHLPIINNDLNYYDSNTPA